MPARVHFEPRGESLCGGNVLEQLLFHAGEHPRQGIAGGRETPKHLRAKTLTAAARRDGYGARQCTPDLVGRPCEHPHVRLGPNGAEPAICRFEHGLVAHVQATHPTRLDDNSHLGKSLSRCNYSSFRAFLGLSCPTEYFDPLSTV